MGRAILISLLDSIFGNSDKPEWVADLLKLFIPLFSSDFDELFAAARLMFHVRLITELVSNWFKIS
jgi:hypothetical protein